MNVGYSRALLGEHGGLYINDTSAHGGDFCQITALTATVVNTSTSNISGLTSFSLSAGQSIVGVFSSITLTSGSVVAYYRKAGGY